jgi:hypothetical protein
MNITLEECQMPNLQWAQRFWRAKKVGTLLHIEISTGCKGFAISSEQDSVEASHSCMRYFQFKRRRQSKCKWPLTSRINGESNGVYLLRIDLNIQYDSIVDIPGITVSI